MHAVVSGSFFSEAWGHCWRAPPRHGSDSNVQMLLEAGADVLALDAEGHPPLYHSVMMGHEPCSRRLATAMLEKSTTTLRTQKLSASLLTCWGAAYHGRSEAMRNLAATLGELSQRSFSARWLQLQGIARSGDVGAMHAALQSLTTEEVQPGWASRNYDPVEDALVEILDLAIMSGSAAMAQVVAMPHRKGSALEIPRVGNLELHSNEQAISRLVQEGHLGRFRALHAVKPPSKSAMAQLLVEACRHQRLEMAHLIWTLGGQETPCCLGHWKQVSKLKTPEFLDYS